MHLFQGTGQHLTRTQPHLFGSKCELTSVVFRRNGNIIALDSRRACVLEFDKNCVYMHTLLTSEDGLHLPSTCHLGDDGVLRVLDGSEIKAFDIGEKPKFHA